MLERLLIISRAIVFCLSRHRHYTTRCLSDLCASRDEIFARSVRGIGAIFVVGVHVIALCTLLLVPKAMTEDHPVAPLNVFVNACVGIRGAERVQATVRYSFGYMID